MKLPILLTVVFLATSVSSQAADEVKPITKVMRARLAMVQSVTKDLAYSDFEAVAKDAGELAAQTKKVGEAAPAAFNKEKNLSISSLATSMAEAAGRKDGAAVSQKLSETLGTCFSCHTKLRDK
jgi:cytochrome c556